MNNFKTAVWRTWIAAAALGVMALFSACTTATPFSSINQASDLDGDESSSFRVISITRDLIKSQKSDRERQTGQDIGQLIGRASPYIIGPGDILSIVVWGHPELAAAVMNLQPPAQAVAEAPATTAPPSGFVVDHEGLLQFPFAGVIKVSGMTEDQARSLLTNKIAHYINKPNVTLRVQAYRSKRIYVDGEVKTPGLQPINDIPMTLVEALNRAGGVLPTADQSQMTVSRNGVTYPINLPNLVQRGVDPASIMLMHGDIVRVLSQVESKVFVAGEVSSPKALTMHNGRLTLNEALGESGGINPLSGDARQVFVVRRTNQEQPTVYQLDAKTPGALAMAEGFELNPKDLVYVAPTALTNWHRTVSLLLPGSLTSAVGVGKQ
ncbi:polysaccharide biosynthesis/export family protein [soil metagenome]